MNHLRWFLMRTRPKQPMKLTPASQQFHDACVQIRDWQFFPSAYRYNLSMSHKHKFIWFRVAKVATRTMLAHFRANEIELDVNQAMYIHYPVNLYEDYFKFAFVRNPWERLASCWQNKVIDDNYFQFDEPTLQRVTRFEGFVEHVGNLDLTKCDHHLSLQSRLIDLNHINYLGRLESFSDDFHAICRVLNVPSDNIPHRNRTIKDGDYRKNYDRRLRDAVYEIYKKDVQVFNYDF